jgi:hypothetical protein
MDRDQAWEIVCEFVKSDSLRKHMLAVEACVAAYAREAGEDEEKWAVACWPSRRCCTISISTFIIRSLQDLARLSAGRDC